MQFHVGQLASLGTLVANDDAEAPAADGAIGNDGVGGKLDALEERLHGFEGHMVVVEAQAIHCAHHVFEHSALPVQLGGKTDGWRHGLHLAVCHLLAHGECLAVGLGECGEVAVTENEVLQLLTAAERSAHLGVERREHGRHDAVV